MSKVKLTKNSWVDLKEIDSEETLEKVKQKFVEAGVGKIDPRYARWGRIGHGYHELKVILGDICFGSPGISNTKDKVSVKDLLGDEEVTHFGKQLFGCKMRVTPEISELVQKAVFEAGGSWVSSGPNVSRLESRFLFVHKNGNVSHEESDEEYFLSLPAPELHIEVVKSLKIVSKKKSKEKELQEIIDNLNEQLHTAQQQLNNIKGE